MARQAPMEISAKVRIPAIWPLRLRSAPTAMPNIMLRMSLNMLFTRLTSSELTAAIMLSMKSSTIITFAFECKVSEKTGHEKGAADLKARAGTNPPAGIGGGDWRRGLAGAGGVDGN